jgi:hypothetical protein
LACTFKNTSRFKDLQNLIAEHSDYKPIIAKRNEALENIDKIVV